MHGPAGFTSRRRRFFCVRGEDEGIERKEGQAMSEHTTPPGRYRHYKGNEYTVIGTARHSETLEELVVYRQEYGEHGLWVRPRPMFSETVKVDGRELPRFEALGSSSEQIGENISNIFDDLPLNLPQELVQILVAAADMCIERIISHGHASHADFWYDQAGQEWVIVLKGAARLQFEDGMVELKPGDYINIPAHKKHRIDWTTPDEPTVWLAVHYNADGRPRPDEQTDQRIIRLLV
jgi:cupin 2 domain-containing protein